MSGFRRLWRNFSNNLDDRKQGYSPVRRHIIGRLSWFGNLIQKKSKIEENIDFGFKDKFPAIILMIGIASKKTSSIFRYPTYKR